MNPFSLVSILGAVAVLLIAAFLVHGFTVARSAGWSLADRCRAAVTIFSPGFDAGAVTLFQSEIWARELLRNLFKDTVYGGPSIVNRNYEGEINGQGDTVRITSIGAITVGSYTGPGSITWQELTDSQQSLLIDQAKYFAFEVDDVDAAQSANGGALLLEGNEEAGYALRDTLDQFIAGLYTGVDAGNDLGTVSVTTAALADAQLVSLNQLLNEANVPRDNRYCVIPPWYESLLLDDANYINAEKSGDGGASFRNGQVGRARGFDIMVSNNTPNPTGDDNVVQAGHRMAITLGEQIVDTKAVEREDSFSDGVKGLHVYGAKLVRPTAIATVTASQT